MWKWTVCVLLLIGFFLNVLGTIIIEEFSGADTAQFGSNNTLKCDFVIKDETGLEVKWFFNDNMQIVSWIPNKNKPQAIGHFKSIIDFNNHLENDTTQSVIHFKDVTFDLTGRYTCKVSGDVDEATKTLNMVVYQPASSLEFVEDGDGESLICSASDIYPMPTISIIGTYTTGSDDAISIVNEFDNVTTTDDGYYNVTKTIVLDKSTLNRTIVFDCNIFIPETAFNETLNVTIEIISNEPTTEIPVYSDSTTNSSVYMITSATINSSTLIPTVQGNEPTTEIPVYSDSTTNSSVYMNTSATINSSTLIPTVQEGGIGAIPSVPSLWVLVCMAILLSSLKS